MEAVKKLGLSEGLIDKTHLAGTLNLQCSLCNKMISFKRPEKLKIPLYSMLCPY